VIFSPKLAHRFLHKYEDQVSEPELKLLLLLLLVLGGLAAKANSEAVLPAYVLGLVLAGTFRRHKEAVGHLRIATFALLTPFYFLKAGALVRFDAVIGGAVVIALLLAVKLAAKGVGVYPLARLFGLDRRTSKYTTLLMSTGLTFGTISAMFGLNRGHVTPAQYSALVTVVIASAVIPTLIAQKHYQHRLKVLRVQSEDEALATTEAPQE
jgi:Kef-type K+ transport system membrane component KefB